MAAPPSMTDAPNTRWVVLLQKAPRGPLSRDEVRALIDQGLLRMNDLAMEIPDPSLGASAAKSDWKLLWQFPEFNRRTGERRKADEGATTKPAPVGPTEQRKRTDRRGPEIPPEEQKRRILEDLPPEIAAIDPSDLAMKTAKNPRPIVEDDARALPPVEPTNNLEAPRWGLIATLGLAAVAGVIAVGLFATRSPSASPDRSAASSSEPRDPNVTSSNPRERRSAAVNRAQMRTLRPGGRRVTGLPAGGELRPFDAASLRRPAPQVSPAARNPDDSADGEYVAPVRRPRIVRPGAPIPADRIVDENPDDEPGSSRSRRPSRVSRPPISDDDDGDNNNDDDSPGDSDDY